MCVTATLKYILLSILIVISICLAACQPTPEEPIIVQKDALEKSFDSMEQQNTTQPLLEPTIQEQKYTVPDMWQDEITQSSTGNKVIIEAEVICPEFDSIDILSITPKNFTQQEVDDLVEYFVGDATLYNGEYQDTKEILEERIIETQSIMAMTQERRDAEFGGLTKEELQRELEKLQARYAAAPDKVVQTAVTTELIIDKFGYEVLNAYADCGGSDDMLIEVFNLAEESSSASFHIRLRDQSGEGEIGTFDGEPEEVAQAVLNDLGLKDAQLREVMKAAASNDPDNRKMNTRLRYGRSIDGIPIRAVCPLIGESEIEYAAPNWHAETISFDVSEKGLTSVYWSHYAKIESVVKENVALEPLEEIMSQFEQYIFMQPIWGQWQEENAEPFTYSITSIELCMVAVPQKNIQGKYLLVPAWNFYGRMDYTMPDNETHNSFYQEITNRSHCLMTLSAIDGTLLHR